MESLGLTQSVTGWPPYIYREISTWKCMFYFSSAGFPKSSCLLSAIREVGHQYLRVLSPTLNPLPPLSLALCDSSFQCRLSLDQGEPGASSDGAQLTKWMMRQGMVRSWSASREGEAGAAELEVALAQHMRVYSRHQQRLQTQMKQP